jgi:hypothetical protein
MPTAAKMLFRNYYNPIPNEAEWAQTEADIN